MQVLTLTKLHQFYAISDTDCITLGWFITKIIRSLRQGNLFWAKVDCSWFTKLATPKTPKLSHLFKKGWNTWTQNKASHQLDSNLHNTYSFQKIQQFTASRVSKVVKYIQSSLFYSNSGRPPISLQATPKAGFPRLGQKKRRADCCGLERNK